MKKRNFAPESMMMSHGHEASHSEGSVKSPIYQTSTFVFNSAEEGKAFFAKAYGIEEETDDEPMGMIYSRIDNPNLNILEQRLCLWDKAEESCVFQSGMAAISTTLLATTKPGDLVLFSSPVYGGTDHFMQHYLPSIGIKTIPFLASESKESLEKKIEDSGLAHKLAMIYIETPANPTNDIFDIEMCSDLAKQFSRPERRTLVAVDNTYMGPVWSQPIEFGADLVIYSATKYLGGHSDLIAGAVLGSSTVIKEIKTLRTFLGNMPSPHTCWLLLRSLETLKIRMEKQVKNAKSLAQFLDHHPKVSSVRYLGLLDPKSKAYDLYKKQYQSSGAMISFEIRGGEREAFQFLNHLKIFKLAVSLGSTEGLAQHPATMTHAGVDPEFRKEIGITDSMVRLSIGIENADDIIWDVQQALSHVKVFQKWSDKKSFLLKENS